MFKHKSIPTSTSVEFVNVEPKSPMISQGVAKVLYLGPNRNGSYFTKDVVNRMIPSLYGVPIVGKYEVRKGDYLGHEKQMQRGLDGKVRTIPLTVPYGYVPENAKVWYQKFIDDDSVEREYLCCDVKLWTGRYPESYRILTKGNHQSMEIDPDTMKGEWTIADNDNSEYFMVSEAYFSALCILGQDIEPCFEGAGIAHEFSLTEEDKIFLFELDKAIEKVKGEYNMKNVKDYMSVEDVKLMLQAGSGEPEVSHVQDGLPTNATVTPADNIVTPAEGLATDANFEEGKEMPKPDCEVTKQEGDEAGKELEKAQTDPSSETPQQKSEAGKELEQLQQEEKKGEVPSENVEKPPFPPKEEGEKGKLKLEIDDVTGKPEIDDETGRLEVEDDIVEVPNAMNPAVSDGLDPVSKIDQIMSEDKDILETELLKKILELLEGKMGVAQQAVPPTDNAPALPQQPQETPTTTVQQAPPTQEIPQPQMPVEQPTQVEQIRRQFELELEQERANYAALEAKHEALMGEFNKLKEFKLQIEMNEKEQVIREYSMLPQSVLDDLREQAKVISKEDLEAKCALAFVKNSKREKKENNIISYSYGQAPQNDFLKDLEAAINKTSK